MMLMEGDFLNTIQIQMVSYSNGYLILFIFFGIYFDMVKICKQSVGVGPEIPLGSQL